MSKNIFLYFFQKLTNQSGEIYDTENIYSFWEKIFTKEKCGEPDNFLIKILYYTVMLKTYKNLPYRNSMLRRLGHRKMTILKTLFENVFVSEHIKNEILDIFCRIQKIIHAFEKWALIYKTKKMEFQVKEDIFLNPISETHKNTFVLVQHNKKYLFAITDLMNIINTALSHCDYFSPEPLIAKNPYNNIPFNKSTFYNIYFFIKERQFKLPILFHYCFLCHFDLILFTKKYDSIICEENIKRYMRYGSIEKLYQDVMGMIIDFKRNNYAKIFIDKDFPKDVLVNKLKPYLQIYLLYSYGSQNHITCDYHYNLWEERMKQFFEINPHFGRKIVSIKKTFDFVQKKKCLINFVGEP